MPSLLALLLACGGNKNVDTHPTPEPPAAPAPEAAPTVAARVAGGASMAAPSPAYAPRAAGFARRFEEALAQPDANTATSGPSAAFVLGMLAQGATGETAAAYTELFGADAEAVRIDDARALAAYNHTDGVELTVVNGLWPDEGTTLDPGVLSNLEMDYRAKPNTVPLTRDPANAKATIDAWTRGNTNGMIEELFTLDQLDDARLVLANAVAFKGRWQEPFDPAMTTEAAFAAPKGPVQVQMMKKAQLTVPYTTGVGFAAVKLPYSGGTTSMIVVLPDEGKSLADAMDGLAADNLAAMAGARPMQVDLALPRFEIRTEHDLLQHAEALGLQGVLGPGAVYAGYGGLIVGSAIQKVVVAVSEEGTEAAAATGVALKRAALAKPVTFHADRPFLFAIWHEPTGTPLFLGQVVDPS
ncbi:MAG: serpin family protein [Myxococcales bacterium]|nr:serpin family protein [Myxococcales bacterium]